MKPVPKPKHDGFKVGPNKLDKNKIATMSAEGVSAKEISLKLKIKLESVESYMPKKEKRKQQKRKRINQWLVP